LWRTFREAGLAYWLADYQAPALETRMFPSGYYISFDSSQKHGISRSINAQIIDHDAAPDPAKRFWIGYAFPGWCG